MDGKILIENVFDLMWLDNTRSCHGYSPNLQKALDGPSEIVTQINNLIYRIMKPLSEKP